VIRHEHDFVRIPHARAETLEVGRDPARATGIVQHREIVARDDDIAGAHGSAPRGAHQNLFRERVAAHQQGRLR
jgi:hypothetical protein